MLSVFRIRIGNSICKNSHIMRDNNASPWRQSSSRPISFLPLPLNAHGTRIKKRSVRIFPHPPASREFANPEMYAVSLFLQQHKPAGRGNKMSTCHILSPSHEIRNSCLLQHSTTICLYPSTPICLYPSYNAVLVAGSMFHAPDVHLISFLLLSLSLES
jgi:hypothetical protein